MSCTLREGLESDRESSRESFEAILAEDEVQDTHWRVGNHEILQEIGRGGMGVIYRARQRHSRRVVALKRMVSYQADSRETLERFRREAEAAASLDHPNILPIYEVGQGEDGLPFFTMKYAAGGSLQQVGPALRGEPRECVRLMAKVARAVQYAHEHGILHRDLKPGNVLLDGHGEPFVTDFGLAKWLDTSTDLTRTLTIFGTPGYIAPEQAKGPAARLTPAADVYSLGALLFDLFTGRPPFLGEHALAVIQQASEKPAPKLRSLTPTLDRDLETICARCLEREPQGRYRSAGDLAVDLERWLQGRPIVARRVSPPVRAWRWSKRNPMLAAATAAAVCSAMAAAFLFFSRNGLPLQSSLDSRLRTIGSIPEKSVAVLPFENRSRDPDNAFFTDGVQDEILTDLARIAALKVISRTSVMQYKTGAKRNLRQIGNDLGVAHVVEGSVQRVGNRVRVSAQLIDARTDAHLWAQTYDRDLADVFAIQSEIAKAIADQLKAKLSPSEKTAIEQPPTTDVTAFNLYSHAKNLFLTAFAGTNGRADLLQAADLLRQAVARDPSFFQAYCQLAFTEINLYRVVDHNPASLAEAEEALQSAARLRPDAGETHLARARNLYWGYLDYDGALRELEIARQRLPGEDWIFSLKGYIERRQGRWDECLRDLERATELDPRNVLTLQQLAITYQQLRRYAEGKAIFECILAFEPNDPATKSLHAFVEFDSKADTRSLHEVTDSIREKNSAALPSIADNWLLCALAERDSAAASKALIALGENPASLGPIADVRFNRPFMEGVLATMAKDDARARAAFTAARAEQEKIVQAQPNHAPAVCVLGLIDAALGRKEEALREGRRAVELLPVEKDALQGAAMVKYLAMIGAWVGEKDLACEQLAIAIRRPSDLSYGQLKLMPFWDALRGDPRFERLVEGAKAPVVLSTSELDARSVANFAPAPEKSIAVLPFENLSRDPDNGYFAEGIQDEILTRLSKIADLKVISRTSTQHYKSAPTNLSDIARQLGVAHILEGSVQKDGDTVRINVQLIKAASDSHLWAETFDRKLTDIFSVESEVAKAIADQLRAKLTAPEEQVIAAKPTDNPEAHDAYLRGLAYSLKTANSPTNASAAQKYLKEAVRLDPKFAVSWALLSFVDARGYRTVTLQPTAALREEARQAAETAITLQPNSGEAVLAKGFYHYACLKDYDTAVRYFEQARPLLPNSSRIPELLAYVARKRGEWNRSETCFNEAEALDPRNVSLLTQHALSYKDRRMFPEASRKLEQILNITPDDVDTIIEKGVIAQAEGDLPRASILLASVQPAADDTNALATQAYQAILERRPAQITSRFKELLAKPDPELGFYKGELRFWLGWTQQIAGDHAAAQESWREARSELESFLKEQPENHILLGDLALAAMSLGDKTAALTLAERAIAVNPIEKDALVGPASVEVLARVAAQTGEVDRAIAALQKLLSMPYAGPLGPGAPLTPALLQLDPMFDPLRNDPRFQKLAAAPLPIPEKSVAVLPFESLSRDPDNAYFAEGVQDEILTRLSKIADLKVISRTSTRQYKSATANVRDIGKQLGVAHILEGSVQKSGDAVRVNVQLIKATTDTHMWAETFDRKMIDILSVESEVAKTIADQLRAKLTGQEEQVIAAKPTENPDAYDAYLRGLAYSLKPANTTANTLGAQKYLREAVRLDPKFALAWALLSSVDSIGYRTAIVQRTPALREEARQAAETALSLQPNLGEAVLAKGYYYYGCLKDYDTAIRYFEQARQLLPNDSRIPESLAYVTRRRGQWEKSESYFNEAERLDVRNANLLTQHALSYMRLRRFPEALRKLDQVLNITPDDVRIVAFKASIAQAEGDLPRAATLLAPLRPNADDPGTLETQVYQAILERRPEPIIPRLKEILAKPDPTLGYLNADMRFWLGWAQETAGDHAEAQKSWQQARSELESYLKEEPENYNILSDLALTNMGLGNKAAAFAFADRAIAANPLEEDAVSGTSPIETLARVAARMGESDRAIAALQKLLSIPAVTDTVAPITAALLRLDPMFDPLGNDPRFQKLASAPLPIDN